MRCGIWAISPSAAKRIPRGCWLPYRGASTWCPATTTRRETVALQLGWTSVQAYVELELEGVRLVLCHYAFRTWRDMGRGAWNLHGHSHGRLKPLPRQADVGVDAWDFRPVTLAQIIAGR